jgi:ABC-2 type transport system ATP-binding protein
LDNGCEIAATVAQDQGRTDCVASLERVPPALLVRGLTKRYEDGAADTARSGLLRRRARGDGSFLALEDFDLEVPEGRFFGLLGPNGAGKTTLISAVCNIIRVTSGEIEVFGEPHHTLAARRMIGLAEQDVNLDRYLDVEETLLYHGGYFGMSRAQARTRAREMMDVFDLRAKAGVRAPKLSGGMRRRLLLARALMHEPRIVILDEPTAGVDFELRIELWAYIRRLHEHGTTVLLTTHYLEEADELCEDIALIRGGRVIARDTADGLRRAFRASSLADVYVKAMAGLDSTDRED